MQARLLLGPSGTGKTFRCLAEVRAAVLQSPSGRPLIFLAPQQATYQLERQLLEDGRVPGFTRLRIVSFQRLAELVLAQFSEGPPQLLNEEGRLMVLRALLTRQRDELELFRASARLRGFAQQLSGVVRELQRAGLGPAEVLALADRLGSHDPLRLKLRDCSTMLAGYLAWLKEHQLRDPDQLLPLATALLHGSSLDGGECGSGRPLDSRPGGGAGPGEPAQSRVAFAGLWMDGLAELSAQELEFIKALLPCCAQATLAFNADRDSIGTVSWLCGWSLVNRTLQRLQEALRRVPGVELKLEWLERVPGRSRFAASPPLQHLERAWWNPVAAPRTAPGSSAAGQDESVCLRVCASPEAEAQEAARVIRRYVRSGGRYRDSAVIVRDLERYFDPIRRVFTAYEIPFFLDRREPVGHHPLLELTRSAARIVTLGWQNEDWFGALKTGLVHGNEADLDRLENEALARGWKEAAWLQPLSIPESPSLQAWLEPLRQKLVAPFQRLALDLGTRPAGRTFAASLANFWNELGVGEVLQGWSNAPLDGPLGAVSGMVHATVWEQMQDWLDNVALAFGEEALSLREWLPILEAGLGSQTVGVIPPALDQVLVGAVDRSRNPDLKLAIVLGLNESVFPAAPGETSLLTGADRQQLTGLGLELGASRRQQLAQEQYLGYIACTRARERLVLTCAQRDGDDQTLNPSPFLDRVQLLFPGLKCEPATVPQEWAQAEHSCELIPALLCAQRNPASGQPFPPGLLAIPSLVRLEQRCRQWRTLAEQERLAPELAEALYGMTLESSVSRLEEYAACPFRFFVTSGLRVEERTRFQVDVRQQGSFQHEVLARFHQHLTSKGQRWRDLHPARARELIGQLAADLIPEYENGLLLADEQSQFTARSLATSLQSFIATLIEWMAQYQFDPHAVELAFGIEEKPLPAWEIELGEGHRLSFRGKIDRVDLWRRPGSSEALCVVMDYKSSAKKLDPVLMRHGVQLQLPAYLNVLRSLADPGPIFGVQRLIPAGVFFVNLRGRYEQARTRREAVESARDARLLAYQHSGRFDTAVLRYLDSREDAGRGDQFNYRLKNDGQLHASCREALDAAAFKQMLDAVDAQLKAMGQQIYAGQVKPDPYRKGNSTACDRCDYASVCRIDPWTHVYRVLE